MFVRYKLYDGGESDSDSDIEFDEDTKKVQRPREMCTFILL